MFSSFERANKIPFNQIITPVPRNIKSKYTNYKYNSNATKAFIYITKSIIIDSIAFIQLHITAAFVLKTNSPHFCSHRHVF